MPSVIKCAKCGNRIISNIHKFQGNLYCDHCYELIMEEAQKLEDEKQKLYNFIKELFSINELPELAIYIIDKALKEGKKLSGIRGTLNYYYRILGKSTDDILNIGRIIQFEYDNACKYYEEARRIQALNEQVNLNVPPINVKIKSTRNERKKPNYNMEEI